MTTSQTFRVCGRRFIVSGAVVLVVAGIVQTLGTQALYWADTARASDALLAGLVSVLVTAAMALFNAYTGSTALLAGIVLMSVASTIESDQAPAPDASTRAADLDGEPERRGTPRRRA